MLLFIVVDYARLNAEKKKEMILIDVNHVCLLTFTLEFVLDLIS